MSERHITDSEEATRTVAAHFSHMLLGGDVVALTGELGAGKTVFVKGILSARGVKEHVTSPTFILINEYNGTVPLYHIDLYRLDNEEDIYSIGLDEYLFSEGICLIEWAEKITTLLPANAIHVTIRHLGSNRRGIDIERSHNK
jgi:tRNA threonylcarbamoyladenosine biosynthesis protein TsaE